MKPASVKELPVEQKLFTEAWEILKAYYHIDAWGNGGEWEELLLRAGKLYKISEENPETSEFAKKLAVAILGYLNKRAEAKLLLQEESK